MAGAPWWLIMKARVWRFLMSIGLYIHKLARPRPPRPAFTRILHSTLSQTPGTFEVTVYTPPSYEKHQQDSFKSVRGGAGYPCIINFHGGGFTLGTSTDDARWVDAAIEQLDCVVISVDYRLGPECPFPTAVEDGADAVLWAAEHAQELGIDPQTFALSGFSSGANLVLTVPVRLYDHAHGLTRQTHLPTPVLVEPPPASQEPAVHKMEPRFDKQARALIKPISEAPSLAASSTSLATASTSTLLSPPSSSDPSSHGSTPTNQSEQHLSVPLLAPLRPANLARNDTARTTCTHSPPTDLPPFRILALASFYPPTDYTRTRAVRRATNPNPKVDLPVGLTALFDESYLQPASTLRMENAYLSPGAMDGDELRAVYSRAGDGRCAMRVLGVACEWDMLASEGSEFARKLRAARRGEVVEAGGDVAADREHAGDDAALEAVGDEEGVLWAVVRGVPHGWDKRPFLSGEAREGIAREYEVVCLGLSEAFTAAGSGGKLEDDGED